jgi:6-phosphogluconolactonase (cycloisomerase 2 family)
VSQYDINPTTGALTVKASAIAAGVGAAGIAVSPDGRSAYVSGAGAIWQYDISPSTGVLSHKSPSSVSAGHASGTDDTSPIAVSPNGKSVYECDGGAAEPAVFEYDVNGATGDLTPKTPASVAAPAEAVNLAIALDGKSVYVTIPFAEKGASEKVVVFAVNRKTGLLSPKSSASATGMTPLGLAAGALPHHRHKHH